MHGVDAGLVAPPTPPGQPAETGSAPEIIETDHVVLAAGSVASPAILLRSGIGAADELRELGVSAEVDAPGVGAALSEHPQVVLEWLPRRALPAPSSVWMARSVDLAADGTPEAAHPGPDDSTTEAIASLVPMHALLDGRRGGAELEPLPVLLADHTPRRRGRLRVRVRVRDADPLSPPRLEYVYLADADDRRRPRDGVRAVHGVLDSPALAAVVARVLGTDARIRRDGAALDAWIDDHLGTALHLCGTVPMGRDDDPRAVVHGTGAVRGVDGLTVADTSILPTAPRRGPANTAVLIGELIADALRSHPA
ncbi:GMC oxidoreductase [Schumannella sp. 10F1B-5-1]|uniref:GMC oxidoreductase n=1 Tax=Schumannella sp. 10F1B-5-1 TaxID=2590780 RepID=UPI00113042F9|nr:GMC oxidoreductase [Schumannella sp. 10F1B-5-1]TPW73766.1 hypothetical protein FJ658_03865 [Schumannella sp. 10F1B-5-1]